MRKDYTQYMVGASLAFIFIIFVILLMLLLNGCCAPPQAVIKDKLITITPEPISDTLMIIQPNSGITDSLLAYKFNSLGDTSISVKVYPKQGRAVIKAKVPAQTINIKDTIWTTKPVIKTIQTEKPYPLISKIGFITIGILIGAAGLIIIKWKL